MSKETKVIVKVHWDSELEVTQVGPVLPVCLSVLEQFCSRQIPLKITVESPGVSESLTFATTLQPDLARNTFGPKFIRAARQSYQKVADDYETNYPVRDASPVRKCVSDSVTSSLRGEFMLLLANLSWTETFASYMEQWEKSAFLRLAQKQMTALLQQRHGSSAAAVVMGLIGKQFTTETWAQIKGFAPSRQGACANCRMKRMLRHRFLPDMTVPEESAVLFCDACSKCLRSVYGFLNSMHTLLHNKRIGTNDHVHMFDIMEQDLQVMLDWTARHN